MKIVFPWAYKTKKVVFLCVIASLCLGVAIGEGSSLSSLPDPHYSDTPPPYLSPLVKKIKYIIYPVLGLPEVVVAGEELTTRVSFDDGGKTLDWSVKITTHHGVNQTYTLTALESSFDASSGHYMVTGIISPQVPRDIFDLVITSEDSGISDRQPNAVRVITEPTRDYRFVHFTDLHLGDPRGVFASPREENGNADPLHRRWHVFNELAFLDPEFVVFSGDLVFGGPYFLEYLWAWEVLSSFSLPIFMVPGNHDGYASGGGVLRDGLEYWKQAIGPPYYSFNYGDTHHFTCVNTYDGSASQRDGFYFVVQKWGGELREEQMEWLEDDLQGASDEGRELIIMGHHDPRGDIHDFGGENNRADEDKDGYAEATEFLDMLFYQEWNDRESGERMVGIIRDINYRGVSTPGVGVITHVLMGHVHGDFIDLDEESNSWWIHTTSAGSATNSSDDFWGYRIIEVENGQIVRVNQTAPEREVMPPGDNDPSNNHLWDYQSYASHNIFINTVKGKNDGTSTLVTQEVTNYLEKSVSGVLKFYMPCVKEEDSGLNNYGYRISGGTVLQISRSGTDGDGDELIFYIETGIGSAEVTRVTLEYTGSEE